MVQASEIRSTDPRPPLIELRVLGTLDLRERGGHSIRSVLAQPKRSALLVYLALARPRGMHQRDTLLALFWAERDQERARKALRQALYYLRSSLGEDALVTIGDTEVGVSPERTWCDAVEFDRACDEERWDDALALYAGELLPGFHVDEAPDFERWLDAERTRLQARAADAAWRLAENAETAGDVAASVGWARTAATLATSDETGARRLMLLLERVGDRAAAIRAYEEFADRLRLQYDVEPSAETRLLHDSIRARDRAVTTLPAHADPARMDVAAAPHATIDTDPAIHTVRVPAIEAAAPRIIARHTKLAVLAAIVLLSAWQTDLIRSLWRDLWYDDSNLRATHYVIFPFDYDDDAGMDLHEQQLLRDALVRWEGISVADRFQVNDAITRLAGIALNSRSAIDVARDLGAGHFFRGEVVRLGPSLRIGVTVYDARRYGGAVRSTQERISTLADADSAFTRIADALLFGSGSLRSVATTGTRSAPARVAFERGLNGINEWQLPAADSGFFAATSADPEFAEAALWLALVRSWRQSVSDWEFAAHRAARGIASLSRRDSTMAEALLLIARDDRPSACELYRRLTSEYEHDFVVWYSYGNCLVRDNAVVPDRTSPSGYAFRTGQHTALESFARAFTMLPSAHRGLSPDLFARIRAMLMIANNDLRLGSGLDGDQRLYLAYPGLLDDTIAFVPHPQEDFAAAGLHVIPATRAAALEKRRDRFYTLARSWSTAYPAGVEAHLAMTLALDFRGDATARDTLRRARALPAPASTREYLAGLEAVLAFKWGLAGDTAALARAIHLADSIVRSTTPARAAMPRVMSGVAALTGRPGLAADHLAAVRLSSPLPLHQQQLGQRLIARSAFGATLDTVLAYAADFERQLELVRDPGAVTSARAEIIARASTLIFPASGRSIVTSSAIDYYLYNAQIALSRGDSAAAAEALSRVEAARRAGGTRWLAPEGVLAEGHLYAALSEPTSAAAWLDDRLHQAIYTSIDQLDVIGVASLIRAAALRAELAAAAGDRETAYRWSSIVVTLWHDADPALRPFVQRMREIARMSR